MTILFCVTCFFLSGSSFFADHACVRLLWSPVVLVARLLSWAAERRQDLHTTVLWCLHALRIYVAEIEPCQGGVALFHFLLLRSKNALGLITLSNQVYSRKPVIVYRLVDIVFEFVAHLLFILVLRGAKALEYLSPPPKKVKTAPHFIQHSVAVELSARLS